MKIINNIPFSKLINFYVLVFSVLLFPRVVLLQKIEYCTLKPNFLNRIIRSKISNVLKIIFELKFQMTLHLLLECDFTLIPKQNNNDNKENKIIDSINHIK